MYTYHLAIPLLGIYETKYVHISTKDMYKIVDLSIIWDGPKTENTQNGSTVNE